MYSPFLDGLPPATPPELFEFPRDASPPTADGSFETHLQRSRDAAQATTEDDNARAGEDANAASPPPTSRKTNQEEGDEARAEETPTVPQNAPRDDASDADEADPADEAVPAGGAATGPTDASGTPAQGGQDHPAPRDVTALSKGATAATLTDQAGADQTSAGETSAGETSKADADRFDPPRLAQTRPEATSPALAAVDASRRGENPSPAAAERGARGATTSAQGTTDGRPNSGEAPDRQAGLVKPDPRAQSPGETRAGGKGAKQSNRVDAEPAVAAATVVENSGLAKEAAAAAGALAAELDPQAEPAAKIEKTAPPAATESNPGTSAASPRNRFAQQLTTGGGERHARTAAAGDVNQTRFVDRVARAFRATDGRGGTIKLRLHPRELGVLQVQLEVQGNALTAKLEAETPAARALLVESLPVLRERLAEQGIRIEQFDVDLMQRQPHNPPDGTGERPADQRPANRLPAANTAAGEPRDENPPPVAGGENQQLNIIV